MPEGDTIFRTARTLNRALAGQVITKFDTVFPKLSRIDEDAPLSGRTVENAEAKGKWLHIRFSGDLILLTHMLMSGSWHIYRPGEKWQRPQSHMRIALHTGPFVAIAFQVQIAEFHTAESLARHRTGARLGPDLLDPAFDSEFAIARLKSQPDHEIGEALLRQALVAGMGNVFKSEVCFAARVNPFRRVKTIGNDELHGLMTNARTLMRANIVEPTGMRRTTSHLDPGERLWVYDRAGKPCRICGTPIRSHKQGLDARSTYWCPACQRV
ncbi:MAG: Fpg/Nei family DNA glycosylase [Acidobacteriota bacterium]|nr:Fpg/Nei family DNA glycosylase [Acidobacteriota bacterium]